MSARLKRDDAVLVVAETLANGAPHPMHGRTGVVLEVRAAVAHPVRVHLDGRSGRPGRTVMLAHDELERVVLTVVDGVADADEGEAECEGHESLDGAHMGETVYCDGTCRPAHRTAVSA